MTSLPTIVPYDRIYPAIVLNDYPDKHYATWVQEQKKTIETRMISFKHRGPIIICCGNSSVTRNAGRALCIVDLYQVRPMTKEDEVMACIENAPGRMAHLLKDWLYFSKSWEFKHHKVSGSFQSIFKVRIPDGIQVVKQLSI